MPIANIITCPDWGARPPEAGIERVPKAKRVIWHHTAGHHRELDGDSSVQSKAEAMQYARDIQAFHMDVRGWLDSGHNFLVCRNGLILQGRWMTVSAIQNGRMVRSAHCPGQNDQIGVELEHRGDEEMTKSQKEGAAKLLAWISHHYRRTTILPVYPHSKYIATTCPANILAAVPEIRARAAAILNA